MVEVLAQMKEICPGMITEKPPTAFPFSTTGTATWLCSLKSTASAYYGYDEFGFGLYDSETQEYHPCLEKDGPYLTALKFYNNPVPEDFLIPTHRHRNMTVW